jgi:hypothetical protein
VYEELIGHHSPHRDVLLRVHHQLISSMIGKPLLSLDAGHPLPEFIGLLCAQTGPEQ